MLNTTPDKVRVLTGNVGGSFGMKSQVYPEYGPLLLAAKTLGRPVKWTDERSESFLQANSIVAGTQAHQVFIGPSALEIYHNYTVSFGAQVPIYQGLGSVFPKERVRFAVNFSYLLFRYSNILTRRFVRKKSPPFCRSCYSPPRPQPKSGLLTSLSLEWIEKCVHTPCACL